MPGTGFVRCIHQFCGLRDPILALHSARKTYISLNPARFFIVPAGNLVVMKYADTVEQSLNRPTDTFYDGEIISFSTTCSFKKFWTARIENRLRIGLLASGLQRPVSNHFCLGHDFDRKRLRLARLR